LDRSASYRIIFLRVTDGYLAWAPAFPQLSGRERSARAAYKSLKDKITQDISNRLRVSQQPPVDPVVQARTFRVDLWYLQEKEELK
jgi:hypothetical protein